MFLCSVQNFGIVSWHGREVLMTMGHPGCEVIERKPSLAEAGRVLVSPGPVPRAPASLCSSQHPEFRSAADLGEETFEVNGSRSGTPSLRGKNAGSCRLRPEVLSYKLMSLFS